MGNISEILDTWELLDYDDKEFTIDILKKQFVDLQRENLSQRAAEAEANYRNGLSKSGNINDLFKEFDDD